MIVLKTDEEIELQRESNLIVGKTLGHIASLVLPGARTKDLDKVAEEFIRDYGGMPSFLGYHGFPASLCISVNSQVVHGIPGDYELKDGDIASIDCGVYKNGFHGDSAYTFCVGNVADDVKKLLHVTKESLYLAIQNAVDGKRLGDISGTIQTYVQGYGYTVVREMVGHGVGRDLHEDPQVPNYGKRGRGILLKEGMVLAIEPMINMGVKDIRQESDGWTVRTADGKPSAHFEHSVAIRKNQADVLSTFDYIEEALKQTV